MVYVYIHHIYIPYTYIYILYIIYYSIIYAAVCVMKKMTKTKICGVDKNFVALCLYEKFEFLVLYSIYVRPPLKKNGAY